MSATEHPALGKESEPGIWQAPATKNLSSEPAAKIARSTTSNPLPEEHALKRKKLSIRSKSSIWQGPSEAELVEIELRQSAKKILQYFLSKQPCVSYDEEYRLNMTTTREMAQCIYSAFEALKKVHRYPHQTKQLFENMTNKVSQSLLEEMGGCAERFAKAASAVLNPQESQKKVSLSEGSRHSLK